MKRSRVVREGITQLNFSKVKHEIEKQIATPELLTELLEIVQQTGSLLVPQGDEQRQAKRDTFVAALRCWLDAHDYQSVRDQLNAHYRQAELCEMGFCEIYSTLTSTPAGQLPPATAAWASIVGAAADLTHVSKTLSEMPPTFIAPNVTFMTPESLRVELFGAHVDPDSATEHYAYNLGGYLKMLGYMHGWFEQDTLVIPAACPVPIQHVNDRSALFLAEAWNQLDDHWGRIRYFEDSSVYLDQRTYSTTEGDREIATLVFEHQWQYFLNIAVARARLRRQVFEVSMHVINSPDREAAISNPTLETVPLFPNGFISTSEEISALALDMCYGLPLMRDDREYLGLKLSEWLRGYALLQMCCRKELSVIPIADGLCYLNRETFEILGERAGLPRERLHLLIKHFTFQKNRRDLFDTPLIGTSDGQYIVISHLVEHSAIPETLTSRINSLLIQIEAKSPLFEQEVRDHFLELGAAVKALRYTNPEGAFECDAAVLWKEDLFLIECKAYTLPRPSASDLFFFRVRQQQAAEQILRIARHVEADPSILTRAFGKNIDVTRTTLCVINLAPFATSAASYAVKFYDRRALAKFSEGTISALLLAPNCETSPYLKTTAVRLWSGENPEPADLLRQLDAPYQHQNESKFWDIATLTVSLSDRLVMLSPYLRRHPDRPSDIGADS